MKQNWKKNKFLITGTIRDGEKTIEKNINVLINAFKGVKELSWLFIESDSNDKTIQILKTLSKNIPDFDFITLGNLSKSIPRRVPRIAVCRNKYIDEIKNNSKYKLKDYIVVADIDGMNELTSSDGIASCFIREDWDACAANHLGPYYDIYALRHKDWCPGDCWKEFAFYRKNGQYIEKAYKNALESKMITIPVDSEWIEVNSAYGGLTIYKKESMLLGKYGGVDDNGDDICDSVVLHKTMRENGKKIFINPKLINIGITFHVKNKLFPWNILKLVKIMVKFLIGKLI